MTEPPSHATIPATPSSRLEELAAEYAIAKPAYEEAKARLDAIVDAIKYELANAAPGSTKVDLVTPVLERPLRLQAITSWRVDTKKLKAEDPATYVRYAKQSTYWELRAVTGGGER